MEKFIISCPSCRKQFEAQEDWIGMSLECPACKKMIYIEKQEDPKAAKKDSGLDKDVGCGVAIIEKQEKPKAAKKDSRAVKEASGGAKKESAVAPKDSGAAKKDSSSNEGVGCVLAIIFTLLAAVAVSLWWYFPRITFWIAAPIALLFLCVFTEGHKVLTWLGIAGIAVWGYFAHVQGSELTRLSRIKSCQFCQKEIQKDAMICRFCKKKQIVLLQGNCPQCKEKFKTEKIVPAVKVKCPFCDQIVLPANLEESDSKSLEKLSSASAVQNNEVKK